MRKNLLLGLRILVAAAGVGYILWSLTWTDRVQVPVDTKLAGGRVLTEAESFRVVSGDAGGFARGQPVSITIDPNARPMPVPTEGRGAGEHQYQFVPGVVTTFSGANVALLLVGLLLVGPVYLIQGWRWLLLLRARGLDVGYGKSFRLLMVGSFFNYCMPVGTTGGDVVKAYYAAKGSDRRADAVMSIVFDRIAGMIGLILVGGVAALTMWRLEVARQMAAIIWLLAACIGGGAIIYFSGPLRRWFGIDWLVNHLPGRGIRQLMVSVDEAAMAYRDHKGTVASAVLLSVAVHMCLITAAILGGYALGISHEFGLMASVMPVLSLGMAIPISYQGLGIMEGIGMPLLATAPYCTANQLIGMLMIYRLYMVVYSMLGSLYLLRGDIHMHPQEQIADHPLAV